MFDALAQAYGWSHKEMMKLTVNQVIMYNYGAWYNYESGTLRAEAERDVDSPLPHGVSTATKVHQGKSLDDMNSEEMVKYVLATDFFGE